jgi:hypothetical protein
VKSPLPIFITLLNTRTAAGAKVPLHFPKHAPLWEQWLLTQVNIPTPRRFYSPVQKGQRSASAARELPKFKCLKI